MSEYTTEMVSIIVAAKPLTFAKAQQIATRDEFVAAGKSHRSVIAKAKSLGLDYTPKPKAAKKTTGDTKADMVRTIADNLELSFEELDGLSNAKAQSLVAIISATTK